MVNRLLRRHGFEDYSTFTAPETLLALDLVNQAIRDLLSVRDYPWNIRSDGALFLFAPIEGDDDATINVGDTACTITPFTGNDVDYTGGTSEGFTVTKLMFPGASSNTAMTVLNVGELGGTLVVNLTNGWPGDSIASGDYKFFFNEYVLPEDISKIISVRHQDRALRLIEVDPHRGFDEYLPRPHDSFGPPEVVLVGGTSTATCVEGTTAAQGLRFVVWPPPDAVTLLDFTYKSRVAELTATTSTLTAPGEFVDDVVDRAEALSNMTQRFNAPELAQQQIRNAGMTADRKWANSVLDPNRRHSFKAHDTVNRRGDPTRYRDVGEL